LAGDARPTDTSAHTTRTRKTLGLYHTPMAGPTKKRPARTTR
jgi:hypothetical protein